MRITYLGHAGFVIEAPKMVLVADPWLSADGAFDSAWFQFPRNHHLAPLVKELLLDSSRARYIYLSHVHKDHFDPACLSGLGGADVTFILPKFKRDSLLREVNGLGGQVVTRTDGEPRSIEDAEVRLFIDEDGLNRDSALLVRTSSGSFL